jgi:hypothetical protein
MFEPLAVPGRHRDGGVHVEAFEVSVQWAG